jgi:hypothetical protein
VGGGRRRCRRRQRDRPLRNNARRQLGVNATHVFWSSPGAQLQIWSRAKFQDRTEVIATHDLPGGATVHADADHVYWLAGRTLWRRPTNLSGPVEMFATDAEGNDFWLDATHVYFARPGHIVRKAKSGAIDDIPLEAPVLVARDATHIYYVSGTGTQEVRRVSACGCGF